MSHKSLSPSVTPDPSSMEVQQEDSIAVAPPEPDHVTENRTRRSSRAKKVPAKYDEEYVIPAHESPSIPAVKRDRPKRKAAQAATEAIVQEEVGPLHDEIFARMTPDERKEYGGWVELESEPGFFNAMLQELDAKDFKVQEVYGLDEVTLGFLPKPVYGLIFLFEYTAGVESSEDRPDCPDGLWFGNQTTANICATVALMNIIMNAEGVRLGPELQQFKSSTKGLPPPHRGHLLDTNDFIRTVHNSVARRNDLIAEDLLLDNKYEAAGKKAKTQKKSTRTKARKKIQIDTNYHYIAYVPADGQVWELDGFEAKPLCLGPIGDSWLNAASPAIQTRMMSNEFASYNLLALCQSPLRTLASSLSTNLACAHALDELFSGSPSWSVPGPFKAFPAPRLAQLGLSREEDITSRQELLPASFREQTSALDFDFAAGLRLAQRLRAEAEGLDAQFVAELASVDEAVETIRGRQRDYTPAIHQWVRVLAEKGVLRELIQEIDREA
ncbi:cysteine proteinase [Whalleya microplaca]|nr:cysteine proteinase [Whalleya microplaca]